MTEVSGNRGGSTSIDIINIPRAHCIVTEDHVYSFLEQETRERWMTHAPYFYIEGQHSRSGNLPVTNLATIS